MKTNLPHVNNYNGLGRSLSSSNFKNKDEILFKLSGHPNRGELLAHLVNFKMYRTSKNNDIEKQDSELTIIEDILKQPNSSITFDEAQHFVRNKSSMFQRQLPNHFKQAIIELTNSNNIVQCQQFINILVSGSKSFLETNSINISALINSNQEALTKKIAKYCTIIPYGYQYDSSKALEMLEKLGNKLEDDTCNSLAIAIIKNCSGYDRYDRDGYARNFSIALKLLEKFDGKLDRQVHNDLAITLIKYCSDIHPNGNIRDIDRALEVLEKFGNQLDDGVRLSLIITLIENCSGINRRDLVCDVSRAQEALEKFIYQLDYKVRHSLIITLIENYSGIDSLDLVRDASRAQEVLEKYGNQLDDGVRLSLIITLIENCSGINRRDLVRDASRAQEALEKYGNQLEDNVCHSLVITLIENCSGIGSNGMIRDSSLVLQALEKFGNQLEDNVRHSLVITLIENYSSIESYGNVRSSFRAQEVLEKYGNQLEDKVRHSLIITLIENCSGVNSLNLVRDAPIALKLLNQNKLWLSEGENNRIYRQVVGNLFDSHDISFLSERKLTQFLGAHGEVISAEAILNKYRQTASIRVVRAIRAYVQGAGRDRRINLPQRTDMQVNGRPLAGIAFEVHNFTDGIESAALKAIDEFLTALKVSKPKFIIDDLVGKFNLIKNEQLRTKANNALNRLLGSENYKEKLESSLPIIAAFLNLDHSTWETAYHDANIYWNTLPNDERVNLALKNRYKDPGSYWQDLTYDQKIDLLRELRWSMWLTQSFIEAGNAYDSGIDSTSCVKGVYERLFTGFRSMHPLIDCLFVTQTVTMEFNEGIKNWLKDTRRANDIVAGLRAQGLTGVEDEEFFKSELKQAYFQVIKKELKRLIGEGLETCFNKLTDFKSLSSYLAEEIKGRASQIIKDALDKVNVILDYLEAIEVDDTQNLNDKQTLDEYIRQQLRVSHQSLLKSLPPLVDE
jgi:hypothetical protein